MTNKTKICCVLLLISLAAECTRADLCSKCNGNV